MTILFKIKIADLEARDACKPAMRRVALIARRGVITGTPENLLSLVEAFAPWIGWLVEQGICPPLQEADLQEANLRRANLHGADLQEADLRGADLQGANLWGANLWGADLQGADLQGANLQGADLRGADLQGADLQEANLRRANLQGVDLQGADLQGAYRLPSDHLIDGWEVAEGRLRWPNTAATVTAAAGTRAGRR